MRIKKNDKSSSKLIKQLRQKATVTLSNVFIDWQTVKGHLRMKRFIIVKKEVTCLTYCSISNLFLSSWNSLTKIKSLSKTSQDTLPTNFFKLSCRCSERKPFFKRSMKKTEILSRDINEEFVEKWDDFLKFVKNPF